MARDLFGYVNQAKSYNLFRPSYPIRLADFLFGDLMPQSGYSNRDVCLDVGCGTGIFTRQISKYFTSVVGLDISDSQLQIARQSSGDFPDLKFIKNDAGSLQDAILSAGLKPNDVTHVTVAQAYHWLDFDQFNSHFCDLLPHATLCILGYTSPQVALSGDGDMSGCELGKGTMSEEKLIILQEMSSKIWSTILPHFKCDRNLVETLYTTLPLEKYFSVEKMFVDDVSVTNLDDICNFLRSVSAYNVLLEESGGEIDVVKQLETEARLLFDDIENLQEMKFPIKRTFAAYKLRKL